MMTKDAGSCRKVLPVATAMFAFLAVALILPQTVAAQAASCGDGVCEGNETFEVCPEDCVPEGAIETDPLMERALDEIQEGEPGYEELMEAKRMWESDRDAAEQQVERALALNRNNGTLPESFNDSGETAEERLDIPRSWILVGIAVIVLGVAFWLYRSSDGLQLLGRDNTMRKSTQARENDLSKRMGELVMRIGEKLEDDVDLDQDELLRKIDEAHDALDEDDHAEAVKLIEDVEEKIHEASDD